MNLEESLAHVKRLGDMPMADDHPPIESASKMVQYMHSQDSSFDLNAYISERFTYHNEEVKQITKLEENLVKGDSFLSFLYTYRGLSRAIPQIQEGDTGNKSELYEKTFEVLQPQVAKMKQLMIFCESAISLVAEVVKAISESRKKEKNFPSEQFLLILAQSLNMFLVMDALKNMKTSLNNDNAMYKRALSNMKKTTQSGKDETTENQKLYMFLATRDYLTSELKKALDAAKGTEETLEDFVELCAELLENKSYVYPETKHILLKAMSFGIVLLDQESPDKNSLMRNKKSMDRFSKLIKTTPVVPLFGDVCLPLESILRKAKFSEASKWSFDSSDDNLKKSYSLITALPEFKEQYKLYISEFGVVMNETRAVRDGGDLPLAQAKSVYNIMQKGCLLASELTRKVLEQSAWKFHQPTDPYTNSDCPQDATDYEKVVRWNYNNQERMALIDFLSMIKSLNSMLSGMDADFGEAARKFIHHDVQQFIHGTLTEIISHVSKKKKASVNLLLHVKEIGGDFLDGHEGTTTLTKKKKEKKGKESEPSTEGLQTFPQRNVGLANSQLSYMRSLLDAAFNEKAPGMKGGFMKDTDFNSTEVNDMNTFVRNSFFHSYILNYTATLDHCCDLSELWYKEFYLELSKQIQFPIEWSLPWILTEHILDHDLPEMTENILYPLDLYNDAAHRALHKLKTQYLYDEIEAEVNLAFDQFIFKLTQNVFTHYKCWASSILINKGYKVQLEELINSHDLRFEAPRNRYKVLLQQTHFQLLGRSIDISKLLSQGMHQNLKRSLEIAILRFEASDLTQILELRSLIEQNRITHELLSQHITLDPFDDLLAEVDEATSLTSLNGRIIAHIMAEIVQDIVPNFCFNSVTERFVRAPFSLTEEVQRAHPPRTQPFFLFGAKQFNQAFTSLFDLNKNFFGEPHYRALISVVGRKSLPVIIGEFSRNLEVLFKQLLNPYVSALMRGFPPSTKLPLFLYKVTGSYEYFYAKLKPLLTYRDLKTEVFQAFREFGNTLCFVYCLDKVMESEEVMNIILSAPFLGITSNSSEMTPEELPVLTNVMLASREYLERSGTTVDFVQLGDKAATLSRARTNPHALFSIILKDFEKSLDEVRGEWRGSVPANEVIEIDYCVEFYRIWSAIQFAICTPPFNPTEFTTRELFGEGLAWAGCTIIHLLDQKSRFNIFDFSYHMANVAVVEKDPLTVVSGVDLGKLVELSNFYRGINDEIFVFLELISGKKERKVGIFHPPTTEGGDGTYDSYPNEHGTAKKVVTEKKITPGGM